MFIAVFCVISIPKPVHAGFFSFLDRFTKQTDELIKENGSANVQNLQLLQAVPNSDSNEGQGGGDITIVNNNALLPDSGPMGTMADIKDAKKEHGQISIYVVREGDSLSEIAKMFDVSVNTIVWTNDIKRGGLITPGQTLMILPISGLQYTIKKGDTLKSIAKKYGADIEEIIDFNGIADGQLAIGTEIIIPNGESSDSQSSTSAKRIRGANGPSYEGYYMRPISGGRKSQGLHGYNGVDLASSCGNPIYASASGDVTISRASGWNGGYGQFIVIDHPNGTQTLYSHLSENNVTEGWHVTKGQTIGYIGNTGKSTGCHLHFEIRGAKNPF